MANLTLFEKLDNIESRYEELTQQLSSPEVHNDSARFQKLAKTHAEMAEMVAKYREWKEIQKGLQGAKQLLVETDDTEMKQMAHDEEHELEARSEIVERELKFLLLPRDPNDDKNVIVEIRAGTGGDEASLFAGELFRMYSRYAETQNWKVEILESSASSIGGTKEIVAACIASSAFQQRSSKDVFTLRQQLSLCCLKRMTLTSRLKQKTCALIRFARPGPAGNR
jgi:peptide chain release factor 1